MNQGFMLRDPFTRSAVSSKLPFYMANGSSAESPDLQIKAVGEAHPGCDWRKNQVLILCAVLEKISRVGAVQLHAFEVGVPAENVLPEEFPLPPRYAHPVVLTRMIRILREGRAQSVQEALGVLKSDLKALNADVQVEQEEYDEVVVIKPLFLVSDYQ